MAKQSVAKDRLDIVETDVIEVRNGEIQVYTHESKGIFQFPGMLMRA